MSALNMDLIDKVVDNVDKVVSGGEETSMWLELFTFSMQINWESGGESTQAEQVSRRSNRRLPQLLISPVGVGEERGEALLAKAQPALPLLLLLEVFTG